MIWICTGLAIVWLALCASPDRDLRKMLVEAPARWLAQLTPGKVICMLGLLFAVSMVIAFAHTDGLLVFGQGTADAAVWIATFDIATYLDVVVLVWLVTTTIRIRGVVRAAVARAARAVRPVMSGTPAPLRRSVGRGARRRRGARKPSKPSAGGDRGWGPFWPLAPA